MNQDGISTRYFKIEPIKWRVLQEKDGKMFLLAESALMALSYYDTTDRRKNNAIFSNNYMHSKVRAWLNGYKYQLDTTDNTTYENKGFLQTAFTTEAQDKIAVTTVDNSGESSLHPFNMFVCADTTDKVFLLSVKEAITTNYGFGSSPGSDNNRIRKLTDFALAIGAYNYGDSLGSYWWLRSPFSESEFFAHCVYIDGSIDAMTFNSYVSWGWWCGRSSFVG